MRVELAIRSMHCEHCARNIERYLSDQPGVTTAAVDFDADRGVIVAEDEVDVDTLVETIDAMGYEVSIRE